MIYILDSVLEEIKESIGNHLPERGGALLGEPDKPIITKFIFDSNAFTTSSSYCPSRKLNKKVKEVEEKEGLEFKGIIHSHPHQYDEPSSQDIVELATGLRLNKHMPFYLAPIVTITEPEDLEAHELAIDTMKVSFYAGFPSEEFDVTLRKMEVRKIPEAQLTKDIEVLCEKKEGFLHPEVFIIAGESEPMLTGKIEVEDQFELLFLVELKYPNCQPRMLLTYVNGNQEELNPQWDSEISFIEMLDKFITEKIKSNSTTSKHIQIKIAGKNMEKIHRSKMGYKLRLSKENKFVLEEK